MASQVAGAASGSSLQSPAIMSLVLARHIRDKLPVQKRENFLELEAWVTSGDDKTVSANRAQLKDYIGRGTFGIVERVCAQCLTAYLHEEFHPLPHEHGRCKRQQGVYLEDVNSVGA